MLGSAAIGFTIAYYSLIVLLLISVSIWTTDKTHWIIFASAIAGAVLGLGMYAYFKFTVPGQLAELGMSAV